MAHHFTTEIYMIVRDLSYESRPESSVAGQFDKSPTRFLPSSLLVSLSLLFESVYRPKGPLIRYAP